MGSAIPALPPSAPLPCYSCPRSSPRSCPPTPTPTPTPTLPAISLWSAEFIPAHLRNGASLGPDPYSARTDPTPDPDPGPDPGPDPHSARPAPAPCIPPGPDPGPDPDPGRGVSWGEGGACRFPAVAASPSAGARGTWAQPGGGLPGRRPLQLLQPLPLPPLATRCLPDRYRQDTSESTESVTLGSRFGSRVVEAERLGRGGFGAATWPAAAAAAAAAGPGEDAAEAVSGTILLERRRAGEIEAVWDDGGMGEGELRPGGSAGCSRACCCCACSLLMLQPATGADGRGGTAGYGTALMLSRLAVGGQVVM